MVTSAHGPESHDDIEQVESVYDVPQGYTDDALGQKDSVDDVEDETTLPEVSAVAEENVYGQLREEDVD